MIQSTAATKIPAAGHALAATTGASGRGAGFAISLTAFLDTATEASDGTGTDTIDPAIRHGDAADGKGLPVGIPAVVDPTVAWLPEVVPILTNGPAKAADGDMPAAAPTGNGAALTVLKAAGLATTSPVAAPNSGAAAKLVTAGLTLTLPTPPASEATPLGQSSPKAEPPALASIAASLFELPAALPGKTAPERPAAVRAHGGPSATPTDAQAAAVAAAGASAASTPALTVLAPVVPAAAKPLTAAMPAASASKPAPLPAAAPTTISALLASTSPSSAPLAPTPLRVIRAVTTTVQADSPEVPPVSAEVVTAPIPATPKIPVAAIPANAGVTQPPAVSALAPASQAPAAPSPSDAQEAYTVTAALAGPVPLADVKTPPTLAPAPQPAAPPRATPSVSEPAATPPVVTTRLAQLAPAFQPLTVGATAPAAQVFAAAIRAAGQDDRGNDRPALDTGTAQLAGLTVDAVRHAVTAAAGSESGSLDMRHEGWPNAMLDHIERLRDSADAADTRIRVVPDALGSIDVSVRKDGDAVHVRFSAEQAATRQLLQDAQPRLADYAEARGLRLAGTGVDAGAGQNAQSGTQRQAAPQPAPPSALVSATEDADAPVSTRIA